MKINLHTVLEVGERDVEEAAKVALAALVKAFESELPTEVTHIASILTTDAGPRQVEPATPAAPAPAAPAPAAPAPATPAPATPAPAAPASADLPDATVPAADSDPTNQAVTEPTAEAAGQ